MKDDADEICRAIVALASESWLGRQRQQWPAHVYHYSDVGNVAEILRDGYVYSRNRLRELGKLALDIASRGVIDHSPWTHDYARFYFRPATPTQVHNEGLRPREHLSKDSHCPVPVFLLFNSQDMLTRDEALYTDRNFARHQHRIGGDAKFFGSLDFRKIYHDSAYPRSMGQPERDEITGARCAEIVYPNQVDIAALQSIVCRTPAERQTLLALLGRELARQWSGRIRTVWNGERMFFNDWTFVREASFTDEGVTLTVRFGPGQYEIQALTRTPDGRETQWAFEPITGIGLHQLTINAGNGHDRVFVRLDICGSRAFEGYLSRRGLF